MTELSNDVEVFKNNTDTQVEEIGKQVNGLREISISPTQPTSNESVWIKKGKNKFNKNAIVSNHYINKDTGALISNENYIASDYINVENISQITISASSYPDATAPGLCFYDKNKTFIKGQTIPKQEQTIEISNNVVFIRTSLLNNQLDSLQIEQGSTVTSYEDYIEKEIYVKNDNGVWERFYSKSEINKHNYSTTEQVIDTWIDGKPIYRKVFEGTSATQTNVTIQNHAENIDTIVHAYGQLENSTGMKLTVLSDNQSNVWANNTFTIYINNASIDTYKYKLIYEYTKTTD